MDTCRLCGTNSELQLGHVIPSFVFKWSKNTSGTGYLRFGATPNKRVQDGIKKYWLCRQCEERFNRVETRFATAIFHPYSSGDRAQFRYGPWMLQFAASVVWRVQLLYREEHGFKKYPPEIVPHLDKAARIWRDYLLGQLPHPGKHQIHMLPTDVIEDVSAPHDLPPNINRYMTRTIDTDIAHGTNISYVYAKLGRFIFLGFAKLDHPERWVGTKIHATEGRVEPRRYVMPRPFGEYIYDRARNMARISASISSRQNEIINRTFLENPERALASSLLKFAANSWNSMRHALSNHRREK